jgi:hypothetical protein
MELSYNSTLTLTSVLDVGRWLSLRPLYAGEKDQVPTAQECGLSGRMGKISPSTASDLLTV